MGIKMRLETQTMHLTHPWEPEYQSNSQLLILGTFPSPKSRQMGFYYGHPQNIFWQTLANSLGVPAPPAQTDARKSFVRQHKIALWDVFQKVTITGAADSSIQQAIPNTFAPIIISSQISAVFTTGQTATNAFNQQCASQVGMRAIYLPSTSPANRRTQATPQFTQRWALIGKVLKGQLVSGKKIKELDQKTINDKGVPSLVLMEHAAQGVVQALKQGVLATKPAQHVNVLCVCGAGNNGGDGFAVARILCSQGIPAEVLFMGDASKMTPETKQQDSLARHCGVVIHHNDLTVIQNANIIVDALFGVGLIRPLSGIYLKAVHAMCKAHAAGAYIVAADIPSGISPDTGEALGGAVTANQTVTFAYPKIGLTIGQGQTCTGKLTTVDIGITM